MPGHDGVVSYVATTTRHQLFKFNVNITVNVINIVPLFNPHSLHISE